jgi:hypothetical protein
MNNKNKALIGSEHKKSVQHRINKGGAGENALSRTAHTQLPRRLEAIYIAFAKDVANSSLVLTRAELDENPSTKLLPDSEKDLLVKFWPAFRLRAQQASKIGMAREDGVKRLAKSQKDANVLKRRYGVKDSMSEPDQLRAMAHITARQFKESAIVLATMPAPEADTDKLDLALWKERSERVKAFAYITKTAIDLAARLEEVTTDELQSAELTDEAQSLLDQTNAELINRGYQHLLSPEITDDVAADEQDSEADDGGQAE